MSGVGSMVGEGTLWGDMGVHMGLTVGIEDLPNGLMTLEFEHKVVGHDSVAFGVVLLVRWVWECLGGGYHVQ